MMISVKSFMELVRNSDGKGVIRNQNKWYSFGDRAWNGLLFTKSHNSFLVGSGSDIQARDKGDTYNGFRVLNSYWKALSSSRAGIDIH